MSNFPKSPCIVLAIDSFKGSMSSMQAARAAAQGIRRVFPDAQLILRPLADGGEGTVDALVDGLGGRLQAVRVTGPLGEPVDCTYGVLGDTAILEMAAAAGLPLVPKSCRNPLHTTTRGVGEMILHAAAQGCRRFIIGIGGSATNDGGAGMLQALGFDLLDSGGKPISEGAQGLADLAQIRTAHAAPILSECTFRIACDVTNPLCGAQGCSAIFGPQKGAAPDMIPQMDAWLSHYAALAQSIIPKADPWSPGTGAAGGLGFAFLSFTHAELVSGVQLILEETHLADVIQHADLVITGEGQLDGQTAMGKAPVGVARLAKRAGKPVIAFAGSIASGASDCLAQGMDTFFPIVRGVTTLEYAMQNAPALLEDAAEQAMRLFRIGLRV